MRTISSFFLTPAIILTSCLSAAAQQYTFETFDVPFQNRGTIAKDINNRGAIVGFFLSPDSRQRGFKRHANGAFEPIIHPLAMNRLTVPAAINIYGVIAGNYTVYDENLQMPQMRAFLRVAETFTDIGSGEINGLNNHGHLAGNSWYMEGPRGFITVDGTTTEFVCPGAKETRAEGIASDDTVVGACGQWGAYVAFLRGPKGNLLKFQVSGATQTVATGINNAAGKIVGYFDEPSGRRHGFIYDYLADLVSLGSADGRAARTVPVQVIDLPDAHWTHITGINSQGVIVGHVDWIWTLKRNGSSFIGTPTP